MSDKYKIIEPDKAYFLTLIVVNWIDIFTRPAYKFLIIDSLFYCQKNKGLVIFAYCLMTNHLHIICRADGKYNLSEILRDFKKYNSKAIINLIKNEFESRREWLLKMFSNECIHLKGSQKYKVWQDGNHAKELYSNKFIDEKIMYIHNNPIEEMIVENPEDYLFSSARNYAGMQGLIDVDVID